MLPLLETSLNRIISHFEGMPMAVVTAYKSTDPPRPRPHWRCQEPDNEKRNKLLQDHILWFDYGYIPTRGWWTNPQTGTIEEEPGYTIPRMTFKEARDLADMFDQYSFVWTPGDKTGMEYRTEDRQTLRVVPWDKFTVYVSPENIKNLGGGTLIKRHKKDHKGFSLGFKDTILPFDAKLPDIPDRDRMESVLQGMVDQMSTGEALREVLFGAESEGRKKLRENLTTEYPNYLKHKLVLEDLVLASFDKDKASPCMLARHGLTQTMVCNLVNKGAMFLKRDGGTDYVQNMLDWLETVGRLYVSKEN